jgi:hypothetical protein
MPIMKRRFGPDGGGFATVSAPLRCNRARDAPRSRVVRAQRAGNIAACRIERRWRECC